MNDGFMRAGGEKTGIERLREEVAFEARRGDNHETSSALAPQERMEKLGRGAMKDAENSQGHETENIYGIYSHEAGAYTKGYNGLHESDLGLREGRSEAPAWNKEQLGTLEGNRATFETILPANDNRNEFSPRKRAKRNLGGDFADADMETVMDAVRTTDDKGLNKAGYEVIRRLEKKLDETGDVAEFFEGCRDLMAKNLRNSYANRRDFLKNYDKAA